jgi:hypothetical protein
MVTSDKNQMQRNFILIVSTPSTNKSVPHISSPTWRINLAKEYKLYAQRKNIGKKLKIQIH